MRICLEDLTGPLTETDIFVKNILVENLKLFAYDISECNTFEDINRVIKKFESEHENLDEKLEGINSNLKKSLFD